MSKRAAKTATKKTGKSTKKGAVRVSKKVAEKVTSTKSKSKSKSKSSKRSASKEEEEDEVVEASEAKGKKGGNTKGLEAARLARLNRRPEDAPNNSTSKIRCFLNVRKAKIVLNQQIKETLGFDLGTQNAQYPYAALTELLFMNVLRSAVEFNNKDPSRAGLYTLTYIGCRSAVLSNLDMNPTVKEAARTYNPEAPVNYVRTVYDSKRLEDFITYKVFTNGDNYDIDSTALNFVCYLVQTMLGEVVRTACILAEYRGLSNINMKSIIRACRIHFRGALGATIEQRLDDVSNTITKKDDEEEEEVADAGDAEEAEEEAGDEESEYEDEDEEDDEDDEEEESEYESEYEDEDDE